MPQMRIDQFYKSTINKKSSGFVTTTKKQPGLRTPLHPKNKKISNAKRKLFLSTQNFVRNKTKEVRVSCTQDAEQILSDEVTIEEEFLVSQRSNSQTTPTKSPSSIKREPSSSGNPSEKFKVPTSPASAGSPSKSTNFHLKVSSPKSKKYSAARRLFSQYVEMDLMARAIENLNLVKQGAIPPNDFNLEEIYSKNTFEYECGSMDAKTFGKYELEDLIIPDQDLYAKILFMSIAKVFSDPINCGYFDEDELDYVYKMITIPEEAQMLLMRMLKRKRCWYRMGSVSYPEIGPDLGRVFEILVSQSLCTKNIEEAGISTMLGLLQVDEIRQLCQKLKIAGSGKKEENISKLLKLANTKTLFPGMKTTKNAVTSLVSKELGHCVRLTEITLDIFDRIVTLLIPNEDPEQSTSDTFFMLFNCYQGKIIFPEMPVSRFPLFYCKAHLLSYIEAKSTLTETLRAIEKKNWQTVQEYGYLAKKKLSVSLEAETKRLKDSTLPKHVRCFMPGYMWLKVLSKTIDAFKRSEETKHEAVEILKYLIKQECHMQRRKGAWFSELALIEMHHYKNLEASVRIILDALNVDTLTHVDKIDLLERASKIVKRKTGLTKDLKSHVQAMIEGRMERTIPTVLSTSNVIQAISMPGNIAGSKSQWRIASTSENQTYGSVEALALYHYCKQEFTHGVHCEGSFPLTLFSTLFWEELYGIEIPGAYVTPYQTAPQDLFTDQFYENRKDRIDTKLEILSCMDAESLSILVEVKYNTYNSYQSLMPSKLFRESAHLKEVVRCIGVDGVAGICRKLIEDFNQWRAGFPDLIVWNNVTKEYKIVEVKGPGDKLSTKQRLWLDCLHRLGLFTEVCLVEKKGGTRRTRRDS